MTTKNLVSRSALKKLEDTVNAAGYGDGKLFCTGGAMENTPLYCDKDWVVLAAAHALKKEIAK